MCDVCKGGWVLSQNRAIPQAHPQGLFLLALFILIFGGGGGGGGIAIE